MIKKLHQTGRKNSIVGRSKSQPSANLKSAEPSLINKPLPKLQPKQKIAWSRKRKVMTACLIILLIVCGSGAWYGSRIIGDIDKVLHGNLFSDVGALFSNTRLKGENQGRVNILLAGDSADDPNHAGPDLTDSIMVISIDTKNHTGFMLSIPRDLWVNIPNWSYHKINAANEVTSFSQAGYPNGGMGQLEEIVQTDLGIPIDYYVLSDYSSFEEAVNAVGGISIDIQSPDPRGLYDSFTGVNLPNGWVTLNGLQALALARARGDNSAGDISYGFPQSDYDRTEHQRQMLVAVAQKAKTAGFIANPIKVTRLFDAFGNNIQTDLNLQDVLRFIHITKGMNIANLKSLTYSDSGTGALLTGYTDPASGEEALIPIAGINNFSQLQQYYQTLTASDP